MPTATPMTTDRQSPRRSRDPDAMPKKDITMDELEDMLMEFGILKSDEEMIAELEAKEAAQRESMAVA